MDTDDLSRETYRAIITEAEKFNSDLTLQFGLLSDNCKDEQEFIDKSTQLINELKIADSGDLKDIFFGNVPNLTRLKKHLIKFQIILQKLNRYQQQKDTLTFDLMKKEFQKISIDEFVAQTIKSNPDLKAGELKRDLEEFKKRKIQGKAV